MSQKIQEIEISKLNLWTENPRDPIKADIGDLEIIKRAIKNEGEKWNLPKLIDKMGGYYHFNKLPIVVEENKIFVVYDGNCRIAILKYLQNPEWSTEIEGTLFSKNEPEELKKLIKIPCAVCDRATALDIIYKDNISNNTWTPLTQSYFEYYLLEREKSLFLEFEEVTGLISKHEKLNQRFVKDEIITEKNLESIGFRIENKKLFFSGKEENAKLVLETLVFLIEEGKINTRSDDKKGTIRVKSGDLGNTIKTLESNIADKIISFEEENKTLFSEKQILNIEKDINTNKGTRRRKKESFLIFGGKLSLKTSEAGDIYKDLTHLYDYYTKNKNTLSNTFPALIRVALRLLTESAAGGFGKLDTYIERNFSDAKKNLTKDDKNTLYNNSVDDEKKLIALLQNGGHTYSASSNIDQTLAMSIIIGAILKITHKK